MGNFAGRIAVLCACITLIAAGADASEPAKHAAQVDKLFERWDRQDSPGCALAIIRDGRVIYRRGYGMADLDHDVPITPYSVFHVASVSKQFTAAAVALLAAQGKLSLDDEVRKHVPEMPRFSQPITVRHLIHHTSGLRDQWSLLGLAGWRYSLDLITDDDVLAMITRQKELNFRPGERYMYSNTGYTLLGQVVKRVSGRSLREFTRDEFFRPLGMQNTRFRDDHAEVVKHQAYGYVPLEKGGFRLSITNFDTVGATSLLTTADDLALWDQNFYDKQVGGSALIERLHERGKLNNGEQLDYAFGLLVTLYKGLHVVEHAGGDAGYRAQLMRFPAQRFAVACLCNAGNANPSQLARQIADIHLAGHLKEEARAPAESVIKLSGQQLAARVGTYWNRDGDQVLRVFLKDSELMATLGNQSAQLEALDGQRMRAVGLNAEIRFEPASSGARPVLSLKFGSGAPERFEPAEEFSPNAKQLAEYTGSYFSEEAEVFYEIAVDGEKLILKRLRHRPATLPPAVRDVFSGPMGNIRFTRDARGLVSGLLVNSGRIRNFRFARANRPGY